MNAPLEQIPAELPRRARPGAFRPSGGPRFVATLGALALLAACGKPLHAGDEKSRAPEPEKVGLSWYSHNLHPERADPSARILTPQAVRVPDGWKEEELTSDKPAWRVSVSGTNPVRKEAAITLSAGSPAWNVRDKLWIALDVVNRGNATVMLEGRLRQPQGEPVGAEVIAPGETRTLAILIMQKLREEHAYLREILPKVFGLPGGHYKNWRNGDADAVSAVALRASSAAPQISLELANLRAVTDFRPPSREELGAAFFPYMDRFGQNRYETWHGKITSVADLRKTARDEEASLQQTPRVKSWDRYGGWADGPQLEATGHFRVQKHGGAWWFVDPEGRLFWSFGVDFVVGENSDETTTPGLREILATIPADEPPPQSLPGLSGEKWSPYRANLFRKFGDTWRTDFVSTAHRRLEAWGMNTLGNWSDQKVISARRTPYVVAIYYWLPPLRPGGDLTDVFAPEFPEKLRAALAKTAAGSADDPWCIGYFVDNEMPFKSAWQLGQEMIQAAPHTATKKAFLQHLQQKYPGIGELNKKWGTSYGGWEDLLKATKLPDGEGCREDAIAFAITFLDRYYSLCRAAVKEAAPNKLYLGSRMNHFFKEAFEICARYADVVSINFYQHSPVSLPLIENPAWDKPFLIGEFHFGTLTEQGVWGPGLAQAKDVAHSARLLERFVDDCLSNPQIIGAHWFQYADQPLSGRKDGENYRVGLVNIADVPYAPLIQSSRALGERMYETRSKTFSAPPR